MYSNASWEAEGMDMGDRPTDDELITAWGMLHEAMNSVQPKLLEAVTPDGKDMAGPWFEVLIRLQRTPGHQLPMSRLAREVSLSTGVSPSWPTGSSVKVMWCGRAVPRTVGWSMPPSQSKDWTSSTGHGSNTSKDFVSTSSTPSEARGSGNSPPSLGPFVTVLWPRTDETRTLDGRIHSVEEEVSVRK